MRRERKRSAWWSAEASTQAGGETGNPGALEFLTGVTKAQSGEAPPSGSPRSAWSLRWVVRVTRCDGVRRMVGLGAGLGAGLIGDFRAIRGGEGGAPRLGRRRAARGGRWVALSTFLFGGDALPRTMAQGSLGRPFGTSDGGPRPLRSFVQTALPRHPQFPLGALAGQIYRFRRFAATVRWVAAFRS